MKKRQPPQALYDFVLTLATTIAQPDAVDEAGVDVAAAKNAKAELIALFHRHQEAGTPDPFLTETVADFTDDPAEQVRLYKLSIEQCAAFPGEPLHSKRCGLIESLLELGHTAEARDELINAKRAAFAARDPEAVKALDALAEQMAV